jgi:fructose-specific component phosphotransferase system IIB-like protein
VFSNWSPYVLLLSGAAAMFLASNAFQAGSLAASQPGLTIVDPLVAGALGVILFGESLRHDPLILVGEVFAVATVIASVVMLSRSPLVQEESGADGTAAPELAGRDDADSLAPPAAGTATARMPWDHVPPTSMPNGAGDKQANLR